MTSGIIEQSADAADGLKEFLGERKYLVMHQFATQDELSVPDLTASVGAAKSTVHMVVNQMVRARLLYMVSSGPRRMVALSPQGKMLLQVILEAETEYQLRPVFPKPGVDLTDEQWQQVAGNLLHDSAPPVKGNTWDEDELSLPTSSLMWEGGTVE